MPQAKSPRPPEHETASITEGSMTEGNYEEVHAAVQELSRLMGVTFPEPANHGAPNGYAVYTYPSPNPNALPAASAGVAPPQLPSFPPWPNGQPVMMTSSPTTQGFGLDPFGGMQVPSGYPAWGPVFFAVR